MAMVLRNWLSGDSNLEEDLKLMRNKAQTLFARADDITTEVTNAELHPAKKRKREVQNWMEKVKDLKSIMDRIKEEIEQGSGTDLRNKILKIIKEIEELLDRGAFCNGVTIHDLASSSLPLLTTDMKGQQFEKNMRMILSWLENDEVYKIGVYGVGGVGKTTLATHIHNQLLRVPGKSTTVYWVTVSQTCTIWELQRKIAKELNLPGRVLEEADEMRRPAILSAMLKKRDNVVVILDDMWDDFPLEKVGLPTGEDGCKVLLTSRSLDVCRRMECKRFVHAGTLSEEESWSLFTEKLGNYDDLSLEAKDIARLVAGECGGLPLGIIVAATSMRGIYDVCEWNTALDDLKDPTRIHQGMEKDVFPLLLRSFSRLDMMLQNSFLSCALYPEDYNLERHMLVNHWITEGHLEKIQSRKKQLDMAHAMINKLVSACLLEPLRGPLSWTSNYVKMHDLIKDMAIRILSQSQPVMIKVGLWFEEVSRLQEWTEELTKVSLVYNRIREIPPGMTPRCPNLSTLLLAKSSLVDIPDSFFQFLSGLKFLDLSSTNIERLPDSISYLENLTSLNLKNCLYLVYIPSLAKLAKLRHLNLNGCQMLENLPQGMEELINLECLILRGCRLKVSLSEVMAKLSNLQCLELGYYAKDTQIRDLQKLGRLERLIGFRIQDKGKFNIYILSPHFRQLTSYQLILGDREMNYRCSSHIYKRSQIVLNRLKIEGEAVQLPDNTQKLTVKYTNFQLRSLVDAFPSLTGLTRLECLEIYRCRGIECIWSESSCAKPALQNLKELNLVFLDGIRALAKGRVEFPPGSLSNLKKLRVGYCYDMEKLFTPCLLKCQLQNLEEIFIQECDKLEEIFAGSELDANANEESGEVSLVIVELPKLRVLSLERLSKLASICKTGLFCCDTIECITVIGCPKLNKLPFSLQVLEDGVPFLKWIEVERDWWESLTWDDPLIKDTLQPFVYFISR